MGGKCFIGAGVHVFVFNAHSTRSAASSKASDKGLAEISKAAGWSNDKRFAMFYKKTISKNFGKVTLRA